MLVLTIFFFTCARDRGSLIVESKPIKLVVLEGCISLGDKSIERVVLGAQVNQHFKRHGAFSRSVRGRRREDLKPRNGSKITKRNVRIRESMARYRLTESSLYR